MLHSIWATLLSGWIASGENAPAFRPKLVTQPDVYSIIYPAEPEILPTETRRTPWGLAYIRSTALDMPPAAKANDLYRVLYAAADDRSRALPASASLREAAERLDRRMDAVYRQDGQVQYARPLALPASGPHRGRGEDLLWKDRQGNVAHFRAYYHRELYVVVMVTATKRTYNRREADKFLASFKLL